MKPVPDVLFKISIEELPDDRDLRRAYYRTKAKSVGKLLVSTEAKFAGIRKALAPLAESFAEEWRQLSLSVDFDGRSRSHLYCSVPTEAENWSAHGTARS